VRPVRFFNSIEDELKWLRKRVKVTQKNASCPPENCADAKAMLKGIRDDLKSYVIELESLETNELFNKHKKGGD